MTLSLTLAILWVFASTIVAFLPMERQFRPGGLLLASAPFLIAALTYDFGAIAGVSAAAAFLSMYRNPLRYLWGKMTRARSKGSAE